MIINGFFVEVKAPASGNDNNPAVETERGHRIPAGI